MVDDAKYKEIMKDYFFIDESWHNFMLPWFKTDGKKILAYLTTLRSKKISYEPEKKDIFKIFALPYHDVKVVILGQDPYPSPGYATGIAFGLKEAVDNFDLSRPSLEVIKKELFRYIPDIELDYKFDHTLQNWQNQGVMLLNSALTVQTWQVGSHQKMWEPFIKSVIQFLGVRKDPVLFVSFGKVAFRILYSELNIKKNVILTFPHPRVDAYTSNPDSYKFIGNNVFNQIDSCLESMGKSKINWLLEEVYTDALPF